MQRPENRTSAKKSLHEEHVGKSTVPPGLENARAAILTTPHWQELFHHLAYAKKGQMVEAVQYNQ